jgi:FlaA1/EpsC-like NDP-sugar epimerase
MGHSAGRSAQTRFGVKVAIDLAVWTLACLSAFQLRAPNRWIELAPVIGWYALASALLKFSLILKFQLDRQVWRHVTVEDVGRLALVVATGSAAMFAVGLAWHEAGIPVPRTVPIIEGVMALLGMAGVRISARMWETRKQRVRAPALAGTLRRVLLVGAGEAGTHIGWEIRRRPASGLLAVGFLDDNPAKAQLTVAGTQVLGRIEDLPRAVRAHRIDEVFITMPSAGGRETRRIADLARSANVECRILPGITQVLSGNVTLAGVRPVQVEDLLRREPVELDLPASYINGRTILVTGAGGSIGSELVRQTALLDPANIILFGHGETALHRIHQELIFSAPELRTTIVIGDVRDRVKIDYVMRRFQPSVVFHAAAHKHVPLLEGDPDEAVLNNIGGTRNLASAALQARVERFVNVSTDKAVRPTSMLGATKSLAEMVVRSVAGEAYEGQSFVSVRFGNVLGSRGSVVEEFQEQIRRGGPLRITDPEMSRYFMTIREASQLVIQAGGLGENGAVYVLNMGTPVRIVDLARDMIHLAGVDEDEIQVVFTGRRPGEKLHEELFGDEEHLEATGYPGMSVAHHEPSVDEWIRANIDQLMSAAERRDWTDLDRYLGILLPGFRPVAAVPSIIPEGILTLPVLEELP